MKFVIIKILAFILIFSITLSSLKRRRVHTKMNPFEGSDLDVTIRRIAQKMCLKVGRDATYIFFGKIKSFIDGTLKDTTLYDKIFENTFSNGIKNKKLDPTTIERKIMTTVSSALGGNSPLQSPRYWQEYAQNIYQQNQDYLSGLVQASSGAFERPKLANDVSDVAGKVVEHGIRAAPKEIISDAISGGGMAGIVIEKLMQVAVNIIQMKLLKQASSKVFTQQQAENNLTQLGAAIIKKNGACGHPIPKTEDDEEGLNSPYFEGNENFIVGRRRIR